MPRDAMQALPMPSWGVCLSVCQSGCVSVSRVFETSKHIFKPFFFTFSRPIILVFLAIFRREPLDRGVEHRGLQPCTWGMKRFAILDKFSFISEMIQGRAIWNASGNSYATYRMVPSPMTLNDPTQSSRNRGHAIFDIEYLRNGTR